MQRSVKGGEGVCVAVFFAFQKIFFFLVKLDLFAKGSLAALDFETQRKKSEAVCFFSSGESCLAVLFINIFNFQSNPNL